MAARKRDNGESSDEQVEILRAIWNEMKALNARVDKTNACLDQTNARLDETNARLDAVRTELKVEIAGLRSELRDEMGSLRNRVVESEGRLATATTTLSGNVQELSGLIRGARSIARTQIGPPLQCQRDPKPEGFGQAPFAERSPFAQPILWWRRIRFGGIGGGPETRAGAGA